MRVGILTRPEPVYSLRRYRENLSGEFSALGVELIDLPVEAFHYKDVDLVWDPALISARFPVPELRECPRPVVGTVHGLAAHTLSIREYFPDPLEATLGQAYHQLVADEWRWFGQKVAMLIAVSRYSAQEVMAVFDIPSARIVPIYHGVSHDIFHPDGERRMADKPYLLLIAQYAVKKNVDRVLAAYLQLSEEERPDLVAILPNYEGPDPEIKGLQLIRTGLSHRELAPWYRGALGFIFPSLHETFGLPILEAMACGCPVITSNVTAMPELTDDAAILVNPRSIDQIADAIERLAEDEALRRELRDKGLARAALFTWAKSARQHLEVFETVLA